MLRDKVIKLSKAKVHVYSDSVLCLGKMHRHPEAMVKWTEQLQYFQSSSEYKELFGSEGEPFEFEWKIFRGHTTVDIFREIGSPSCLCSTTSKTLARGDPMRIHGYSKQEQRFRLVEH